MQENLTELMSSRICHDLISPVGAIGNGLELMNELSGPSPELELVGQSAQTAQAKLKFFRVAFGASNGAKIGGPEAARTASEMFNSGRLSITFTDSWGDRQRSLTKLFYLLLLCVETSLPRGGQIVCSPTASGWDITVNNTPVNEAIELWNHVRNGQKTNSVTAKTIQFTLARESLVSQSIALSIQFEPNKLSLSF